MCGNQSFGIEQDSHHSLVSRRDALQKEAASAEAAAWSLDATHPACDRARWLRTAANVATEAVRRSVSRSSSTKL